MNPKMTTYDELNKKYRNQFIWTSLVDAHKSFYQAQQEAYLFGIKDNFNIKDSLLDNINLTKLDEELIKL